MSEALQKLLILDLDETLIHATENKLEFPEDFRVEQYFIHKRPYLEDFLSNISKYYRLGIWSSADDEYVTEIVRSIKPADLEFEIVWGRSRCSVKKDHALDQYYFEKRLDKLKRKGFDLGHILIVDDSPEKSRGNYGNAIYIREYLGDRTDTELRYLQNYLIGICDSKNFRAVEKRGWRSKVI